MRPQANRQTICRATYINDTIAIMQEINADLIGKIHGGSPGLLLPQKLRSHRLPLHPFAPPEHSKGPQSNEKPDSVGLTVPGMPMGSPGMEQDAEFDKYNVLLVKKDGTTEVFASHLANNRSGPINFPQLVASLAREADIANKDVFAKTARISIVGTIRMGQKADVRTTQRVVRFMP
jgi:Protein of unknown function, DUF